MTPLERLAYIKGLVDISIVVAKLPDAESNKWLKRIIDRISFEIDQL